jgi:putative two-component system response regulator
VTAPNSDISTENACPIDRRDGARNDPANRSHLDAIYSLARLSEVHDQDTGSHVLRIRSIVEQIALRLGFTSADAAALGDDAILHDVGKLRVPVDVLKKPDAFNDHERDLMQQHTVRGERLIRGLDGMQRAARIARCHHERWDGSGYPDGLVGEAIPLEARITAAADVLDALIATRCYKQSWSYADAMNEVLALSGTHLDPSVIDAVKQCNAEGALCGIFGLPTQCATD